MAIHQYQNELHTAPIQANEKQNFDASFRPWARADVQ